MHHVIRNTVTFSLAILCCLGLCSCQSKVDPTVPLTTSVPSAATNAATTASQTTHATSHSRPADSSAPSLTTAAPTTSGTRTPQTTTKPTSVTDKGPLRKPKIVVRKGDRVLELWDGDQLFGSYRIGLGFTPLGHKQVEGDGKTPEGEYYVCTRNGNSRFYLALGISYPNIKDAEAGLAAGRIDQPTLRQIREAIENKLRPPWNTPLGGEIMIHGHGSQSDWTAGCIAVDNDVMDILWKHCPLRTPITIKP